MDTPVTLLYTHNLRGDLDLLPRLYTFIRHLKALRVDDDDDVMLCAVQPQARRTLLLDLGGSCAPDAWHCAATEGRSMLIALDAMGYDAANITGQLAPEVRDKLRETVQMALIDTNERWESNGVIASITHPSDSGGLHIVCQPAATLRLEGRALYPRALSAGQVGVAHLSFSVGMPYLISEHVFTMPPDTRPDPTIMGAVEFVTSEARYYQKKRGG